MESSATPYAAVVVINGIEHGRGMGSSKKEAKSEAARKTLELLIPDFKKLLEAKNGYVTKETVDLSVSVFGYSRLRNKHRVCLLIFGLFSRGYVPY